MQAPSISGGAILACERCTHAMCCSRAVRGGPFEPAFVTTTDALRIERTTGMPREVFSLVEGNPDGTAGRYLRTHAQGGCIFFDEVLRRCRIYADRPVDCRLFPMDVVKQGHEYVLILYVTHPCVVTDIERERLIDYFDSVLMPALQGHIAAYAQAPSGLLRAGAWILLKSLGNLSAQGPAGVQEEAARYPQD